MKTIGLCVTALGLGGANAVTGQNVLVRFDVVGLTYQEVSANQGQSVGGGAGAGIEFRWRRFRFDLRGYTARVRPVGPGRVNFDFSQYDGRVGYFLTDFLAVEVGGGRRNVTPEFAAPDVGVMRIGVLSENQLHRQAKVWVRGAYIGDPRFNTGGSANMAFEFSLGVAFGSSGGGFRVHAEYEFQRIDRVVQNNDVPMQLSLVRTGVALGF